MANQPIIGGATGVDFNDPFSGILNTVGNIFALKEYRKAGLLNSPERQVNETPVQTSQATTSGGLSVGTGVAIAGGVVAAGILLYLILK